MRQAKSAERLRRLLVVVPFIVQHPGIRVAEVAAAFGIEERDLLSDLNLLFMSGLPPYGPGDLIDVQIEDGRVWVAMADYFAKPLRLSRTEALSLYLRAKALLGAPGLPEAGALSSAIAKIEDGLGPEGLGEASRSIESAEAGPPAEVLDLIRRAAAEHERIEIDYYAASRDATSRRRIDPEEVFSAIGNWYVVAWDEEADDERMFRADRIREAHPTGRRFEPRGLAGAGRPLYTSSPGDERVRLLLQPAARWVAEYYEVESADERPGGGLEVVLPTKQLAWVAKLMVRLAGEVSVLEPRELRDAARAEAEAALARYR